MLAHMKLCMKCSALTEEIHGGNKGLPEHATRTQVDKNISPKTILSRDGRVILSWLDVNFFKPMTYIRCNVLPWATYYDVHMTSCLGMPIFQVMYGEGSCMQPL